jgi:Cu/Ag efflux protein CusF
MKKILLVASIAAVLAGAMALLRADDMGNMQGMNMGGMQTNSPMANTNSASNVQSYHVRGIVEKLAPDLRQATIHNENIPGYMDEMTMDFRVQNTNELNGISPGDQITFKLIVSTNDEWIEDIKRTGQTMPVMTNSMSSMDMSETNR